jgi:hypothetical protein
MIEANGGAPIKCFRRVNFVIALRHSISALSRRGRTAAAERLRRSRFHSQLNGHTARVSLPDPIKQARF